MEVKLIAMTDAMWEDKPAGSLASPEQVCNHAAKTCTSKDAGTMAGTWYVEDEPVPVWNDLDMKPLMSALRSGHESVLEHAVYTFEVKGVSRALTHQLVRHRIASYSQQSQRYVNMGRFGYVVPESIGKLTDENKFLLKEYVGLMNRIHETYNMLIENGCPEEDARYVLPNACTTNIIVTMNARELIAYFKYRVCNRAQWEIRELANRMLEICKQVSPTIFAHAGANCDVLGYCPEQKSCGKCPRFTDLKDRGSEDGQ